MFILWLIIQDVTSRLLAALRALYFYMLKDWSKKLVVEIASLQVAIQSNTRARSNVGGFFLFFSSLTFFPNIFQSRFDSVLSQHRAMQLDWR